jgi:hypothetical protein
LTPGVATLSSEQPDGLQHVAPGHGRAGPQGQSEDGRDDEHAAETDHADRVFDRLAGNLRRFAA